MVSKENLSLKELFVREPEVFAHSQRVSMYSYYTAIEMKLSQKDISLITAAGMLHDLGKLRIPKSILQKPAKLTAAEWDVIKMHPIYSAEILSNAHVSKEIVTIAKNHHHYYDGSGYPLDPNHLKGNINQYIISMADAFDAMTSNRSYREGMPVSKACDEIERKSGTQFCPQIVKPFITCVSKFAELKN